MHAPQVGLVSEAPGGEIRHLLSRTPERQLRQQDPTQSSDQRPGQQEDADQEGNACTIPSGAMQGIENRLGICSGHGQDGAGEPGQLPSSNAERLEQFPQIAKEGLRPFDVPGDRFGIGCHAAKLARDLGSLARCAREFAKA